MGLASLGRPHGRRRRAGGLWRRYSAAAMIDGGLPVIPGSWAKVPPRFQPVRMGDEQRAGRPLIVCTPGSGAGYADDSVVGDHRLGARAVDDARVMFADPGEGYPAASESCADDRDCRAAGMPNARCAVSKKLSDARARMCREHAGWQRRRHGSRRRHGRRPSATRKVPVPSMHCDAHASPQYVSPDLGTAIAPTSYRALSSPARRFQSTARRIVPRPRQC
jgi:hypothetical protein